MVYAERRCKHCGKEFTVTRKDKVFCSRKCGNADWIMKHPRIKSQQIEEDGEVARCGKR